MKLLSGNKKGPTLSDLMSEALGVRERLTTLLIQLRLESESTFEQIEKATGILASEYQALEYGFRLIEQAQINKICEFYGVDAVRKFHYLLNDLMTEAQIHRLNRDTFFVS